MPLDLRALNNLRGIAYALIESACAASSSLQVNRFLDSSMFLVSTLQSKQQGGR